MRILSVIFCVITTAAMAVSDEPANQLSQQKLASDLVKQLGEKKFATRESAAKKLLEMGVDAIPALTVGSKSADEEEVRSRCSELLNRVKVSELKRRADAYQADIVNKQKHSLPLLVDWEKITGKPEVDSRRLFAEMIRINGPLFELASVDKKAAISAFKTQSKELIVNTRTRNPLVGPKEIPVELVASILFVQLISAKVDKEDRQDDFQPSYLIYNPSVMAAAKSKEIGRPFRVLLSEWIKSRPFTDLASYYAFNDLAIRQPFPEAVPQLVRVLGKFKGEAFGAETLVAISNAGHQAAMPALIAMLDDSSVMWLKTKAGDVKPQLRDCALAMLARFTDKAPEDFGLKPSVSWNLDFNNPKERIVVKLYAFESEDVRTEGMKKWKEFASKK